MSDFRDWQGREADESQTDRFAWFVVGLVALAVVVGLVLIATNRWPT